MTANVITYRNRSAAREVGKALGMRAEDVDRLAKIMTPFEWRDPKETLARDLTEAGLDGGDPMTRLFADLWMRMQDLPRHLGQHSGGMVMCQGRLDDIVPLEPAAMPGRVVIQWDKEDCADMGIVKVDLLGLGMMAVLQDALTIINRGSGLRAQGSGVTPADGVRPTPHGPSTDGSVQPSAFGNGTGQSDKHSKLKTHNSELLCVPPSDQRPAASAHADVPSDQPPATSDRFVDLAHLPPDDPTVYRMLQTADTIGIFQVESRAQMATLPRLKPTRFYDIVVEVAIIRPGPIVGQMVHPYLSRRAGREPITYAHPLLVPILERTLGVPLFQEQLLRMAMVVANFTGGEAEELRRAMGFKRSEARMRKIEAKLRAGMAANGITTEKADEIVRSITSFALYGFPESHAASFALLVYASAYLKAHFPAAFYAALLNNQPMGFYHPATLVKDAQRHGVRFKAIDVQESDWQCRIETDGAVRLGLCYVRGLREQVGRAIEQVPRVVPASVADGIPARLGGDAWTGRDTALGRGAGQPARCPKCGTDDGSMIESIDRTPSGEDLWFCNICAHDWILRAANREEGSRLRAPGSGRLTAQGPASSGQRPVASREEGSGLTPAYARRHTPHGPQTEDSFQRSALSQDRSDKHPELKTQNSELLLASAPSDQQPAPSAHAAVPSDQRPATSNDDGVSSRQVPAASRRFVSLDQFVAATGVRRDELAVLAEIGALRAFGYDRRGALWQIERAVRPAGALFENVDDATATSPLAPMTRVERVVADYEGTSLTIGPHPMALRRGELSLRGVLRAIDLPGARAGRRVRVAGAVITRQRPGTAKGFAFLTLEDETGISNIIVRPDLFDAHRPVIVGEPFLLIEGVLQQQDGVTSVRAERLLPLGGVQPAIESHDFH